MEILYKFLLVAFLCWLVPFVVSLPFFSPEGQLLINFWFFKAIMVSFLILTTFLLLRWFYRRTALPTTNSAPLTLIGIGILVINILLDSISILQLKPMPLAAYTSEIAWIYLLFIPLSLLTGRAKKEAVHHGR